MTTPTQAAASTSWSVSPTRRAVLQFKLGFIDSPDVKIGLGYSFGQR
jgi:hypothetical protein